MYKYIYIYMYEYVPGPVAAPPRGMVPYSLT